MLNTRKPEMDVGRFTIPYRIWGDCGPHILCVNGIYQSMAVWRPLVRHFRKRFTVAAFDFPGQGSATIHTGGPRVTLDEQAEILDAMIRMLGTGRGTDPEIHLFSASWGSVVASYYLSRVQNASVKKMILASFGMKHNPHVFPLIRQGQAAFHQGDCAACGEQLLEGLGERVPEQLRVKIRQQFSGLSKKDLETLNEHMEYVQTMEDLDAMIDFGKISAKTLVINGSEDVIVDAQANLVFADLIPDCRVVLVPNAGHFLHLENPSICDVYERFYLGTGEFEEGRPPSDVPSPRKEASCVFPGVRCGALG